VDHVVPLAKGGIESITNLQILCETCNLKKGSKLDPAVIYIRFDNQERNT
jgi:5-methylcytosine-specific restriction endonuclease McrA